MELWHLTYNNGFLLQINDTYLIMKIVYYIKLDFFCEENARRAGQLNQEVNQTGSENQEENQLMERLQVFVMILPYSTVSLQYPTMFLSIILHYIPKDILLPILFSNLIVTNHSSNVLATFTLVE